MPKTTVASAPNEVTKLLEEAAARGHLVVVRALPPPPPHDDAKASLLIALNQLFGLTPAQSRILAALLEHGFVSREALHAATARDGNPVSGIKTLDVLVGRMREKLKPHGIEITTIWGRGFTLIATARDKLCKLIAEHQAEITSLPRPDRAAAKPSEPNTKPDAS